MKSLTLKISFYLFAMLISSCMGGSSSESSTISAEEYQKSQKVVVENTTSEIIGKWYDASPYIENYITISKTNGVYKMKRVFKDGSEKDVEVPFSKVAGKSKFVTDVERGGYAIIETNGELAIYDSEGYIKTCKIAQ